MIWSWLFLSTVAIRLAFWTLIFRKNRSNNKTSNHSTNQNLGVSIIVCARNEAANLQELIPLLCAQMLSCFEVIIVDHASTDETQSILKDFKKTIDQNIDFNFITLSDQAFGKKFALEKGISIAKYEFILLTDADCRPASMFWAQLMLSSLQENQEIAVGFSPMTKKRGLANYISRFETLQTAIQYSSFANAGLPYMCVGRNWGFAKSLYERVGGNKSHAHLAAGDDDLQMQAMSTSTNVAVCYHPDGFTFTNTKPTMSKYLSQKSRHVGVANHYKPIYKVLLALLAFSHFGFFVFGVFSMFNGYMLLVVLISIGYYLLIFPIHYHFFKRFDERLLSISYPIFDIAFFLLNPLIFVLSIFRNKNKWN